MKLLGISAIIGLVSAATQIDEPPQDSAAIAVQTPTWHTHTDFQYEGYYADDWYHAITLEEVPNAGENTHDICKGIHNMAEGWCPGSNDHIMRAYSDLVVTHFMPKSAAAGALDESEAANIPTLMTAFRTKTWSNNNEPAITIPATIDNALALAERGTDSANDVYDCGPTYGTERSFVQSQIRNGDAGFVDATADSAATPCLAIGNQGFYGDDVEKNFRMKNVACTATMYLICVRNMHPGATTHGGHGTVIKTFNSTNVDIMKAALNLVNDPGNAPRDSYGYLPYPHCLEDAKGCKDHQNNDNHNNPGHEENNQEQHEHHHQQDNRSPCDKKMQEMLIMGLAISGGPALFNLWFTFFICCFFKCCISRDTRRKFFNFSSYALSYCFIGALAVGVIFGFYDLIFAETCRGSGFNVLVPSLGIYPFVALLYGACSRSWNRLQSLKNIGDGKNFNIWKEINVNESPTIQAYVECYHWETVHYTEQEGYTDSDGQYKYRTVHKTRQEKRVTWSSSPLIPYTTWWVGDGEGNPHAQESGSKTYIGTCPDRMTFAEFKYSLKAVDQYTTDQCDAFKNGLIAANKHRDQCCSASWKFGSWKKGSAKLTIKPESMKLPSYCEPGNFWKYTLLPFPYYNGAKLREMINNDLSVEVTKNIVRFVEIKPNTMGTNINNVRPQYDWSRGYQRTDRRYSSSSVTAPPPQALGSFKMGDQSQAAPPLPPPQLPQVPQALPQAPQAPMMQPMMQPAMAPVMQPGMQPVMQSEMQSEMQPGMQPVMQPGMQQGIQPVMQQQYAQQQYAQQQYAQQQALQPPPKSDGSGNHLITKEKKGLIKKLHDDPMGGLCCLFIIIQPLGALCCLIADCNTCEYNKKLEKAVKSAPKPAGKWRKYFNQNLFYGDNLPIEAPQSNLIIHNYKAPVGTKISLDYGNPPVIKRLTVTRTSPDPIEDVKRIVEDLRCDHPYTGFTVYSDFDHCVVRQFRENRTLQPAVGYDCQTYIYTPPGEPENQGVISNEPVYLQ